MLASLFRTIGFEKNGIILPIYKKGDMKDLKNYRPISLLPVLYKLFTKVLTSRNTATLDSNQPKEQAGFRSGYSTISYNHVNNEVVVTCKIH